MQTKTEMRERLQRVVNTICATKMRVDQTEATDRMRACVRELQAMVEELENDEDRDEQGEDVRS